MQAAPPPRRPLAATQQNSTFPGAPGMLGAASSRGDFSTPPHVHTSCALRRTTCRGQRHSLCVEVLFDGHHHAPFRFDFVLSSLLPGLRCFRSSVSPHLTSASVLSVHFLPVDGVPAVILQGVVHLPAEFAAKGSE